MELVVESTPDPGAWDDFVSCRSSGNFMQSPAWGRFQAELGWAAHFCALRDGEEVQGAALLLSRKVPGLGRVFQAPRGPVVDFDDQATVESLMRELGDYVRGAGGIFLRCDPYVAEPKDLVGRFSIPHATPVPRDWSDWNGPRFVFWLSLEGDEEDVMMRMTSRCRNDIRRGYRNDVEFSLGTEDDLEDFHRLMVLTGQEKGIAFHGIDYYRMLLSVVDSSAKAQLFLGRFEGKVVTTGMSVKYGDKAWLLYAATDPEHYKLRATRTQQWEMIKWAHAHGCVRYDFRGTATNDPPSEDDPGYGVYQFKKSFGPEFTRLVGYYDLVQRPLRYRILRTVEDYALPAAYRVRTWIQG